MIPDYLGRSPIFLPAFIIGKLAFLGCSLFLLLKRLAPDTMLFGSMFTQALGVMLYSFGFILLIVSLVQLGTSTAVGIPVKCLDYRRQVPRYIGVSSRLPSRRNDS